ncbi:MAG: sulfate respiration complex hexadecaheme cytochrome HmcA [Thermodesulfobacteriota bacterium]
MRKRKTRLFAAATGLLLGILLVAGLSAADQEGAATDTGRPDIVVIDDMSVFGDLTRPPVHFFHDAHVTALKKEGKDCLACHLKKREDLPSLLFMRLSDTDKKTVRGVFHDNCMGCHKEMRAQGKETGPLECGQCHDPEPKVASTRTLIPFSRPLHYVHTKDEKNKCEACHHAYDKASKKLYYDKGKEGSCQYCHGEKTTDTGMAWNEAAHLSCIRCHMGTIAQGKKAGPTQCAGCHDAAQRAKIKLPTDAPRYQRNQPDFSLLWPEAIQGRTRMEPVSLAHAFHENEAASCRDCHHASLARCGECHSVSGKKEGDFVTAEKSGHSTDSVSSCVGCHVKEQEQAKCAACHASMEKGPKNEQACGACHMPAPFSAEVLDQMSTEQKAVASRMMDDSRKRFLDTIPENEVPETVTMQALKNEYGPVALPHRKIVSALNRQVRDDRLASAFHPSELTLCQGCHHNSPASKTPPRCTSCHSVQKGNGASMKPGAVEAYHQQCLDCHKILNIEKAQGCTDCHKKNPEAKAAE